MEVKFKIFLYRLIKQKHTLSYNNNVLLLLEILLNEKKIREFLGKRDLTIRQVRCIIVGCAGAGKTTLLKRLQNIPYKELKKIESTEMVDVHVNSFKVLEDKETIGSKFSSVRVSSTEIPYIYICPFQISTTFG